nr:digestive cysteine proteinase 2-like [Cherax quadricarinatus]
MKVAILLLLCSLGLVFAGMSWQEFKDKYNKQYETVEEETYRKKIFEENLQYIEDVNRKYEKGEVSYNLNMNKFGDLTAEELKSIMNGYRGKAK